MDNESVLKLVEGDIILAGNPQDEFEFISCEFDDWNSEYIVSVRCIHDWSRSRKGEVTQFWSESITKAESVEQV